MFPKGTPDPEYPDDTSQSGTRLDGQNLVEKWLENHQVIWVPGERSKQGQGRTVPQGCVLRLALSLQGGRYVWNREAFLQASQDPAVTHLMGNALVLSWHLSVGLCVCHEPPSPLPSLVVTMDSCASQASLSQQI